MKDLNKLADICKAQLDKIGIKYGNVTFSVNTRAKKRWGQCRVVGADTYEISISERLLDDSLDDIAALNTIMHELAHAADGCKSGHRGRWLKIAAVIMKAYPEYNIKRCSSPEEKGIDEPISAPAKQMQYKYFYCCLACGYEIKYKRSSKFTKNPNAFVCGKCRGRFVTKAVYEFLSPAQRKAVNEALGRSAPKPVSPKEWDKIMNMK